MKKSANVAVALIGIMLAMPVVAQEAEADAVEPELEAAAEPAAGEEVVADEAIAAESEISDAAPAEDAAAEAPVEEAATEDMSAEAAAADDAVAEAEAAPAGEVAAEEAVAEETAAEEMTGEASVAEEAPMEEAAAEEAVSEDSLAAEDGSAESGSEEAASEDDGEPFYLYAGVDMVEVRASFSDDALAAKFGGDKLNSSYYRLRVGTRLFDAIGVEAHYGIPDQDDSGEGNFETGEYYGAFLVPTGVFLDVVEISAPVGYTLTKVERGGASEKFDALSFGLNIEVPITLDSEWFPDIRIGGGGTVYQAKNDARIYGYHFGVRLDFKL
jgi:hypothetical protein